MQLKIQKTSTFFSIIFMSNIKLAALFLASLPTKGQVIVSGEFGHTPVVLIIPIELSKHLKSECYQRSNIWWQQVKNHFRSYSYVR